MYEDDSWNAVYDDTWCPEPYDSTYISVHQFNTTTGVGSVTGTLEYVGGSHLGEIPLDAREGTTYGGTTNNAMGCIPDGYDYRWDCQAYYIEHPIGTENDTWSSVKSLYR